MGARVFGEMSFGEIERGGSFRGETAAPCSHVRGNHESLGAGYVEEAAPKCRSIEEGFLASRPAWFNAFFGVAVSTRTPTRPDRSDKRTNDERPLELPY
jgi:hypothetical protein